MGIDMRFDGLDELIKECLKHSSKEFIEKVDRKLLKECGMRTKVKVSSRMLRSADVSKSGRKGSRPGIHSADAVPVSGVRKKGHRLYIIVGWDKGDNSPYFYTKFNEFGTSKRSPFPVFLPATKEAYRELEAMGVAEYEKLLKFLEG